MVALLATNLIGILLLIIRTRDSGGSDVRQKIDQLSVRLADILTGVQSGFVGLREETSTSARLAREEISARVDSLGSTIATTIGGLGKAQGERLDGFGTQLADTRTASEGHAKSLREELVASFDKLSTGVSGRMGEQAVEQTRRFDSFTTLLGEHRKSGGDEAKSLREEVGQTLSMLGKRLTEGLDGAATKQAEGLTAVTSTIKEMTAANEQRQEALKGSVESRLDTIRTENAEKLEQMRVTVDEKLQGTLEARLGASFTQVNENLERVYRSVGEMQTIASGVGDLKRVLTNVKSRGTWGEVTLGFLLEQVMTPEQYAQNVEVRPNSGQRVEYAIKLPGDGDAPLWLPIDAKMPTEDYERLVEASERGDVTAIDEAVKGIEKAIKLAAKDICSKYVCPPHTTDFAIMFLPNEGIYAEVVRRPGLVDTLQRECRVSVAGPTNLMAMLTSFRMGFRTLAIQERSSEVWKVLGNVKHEFGKFGDVLDKVQKKLGEAQNVVEAAGIRRRAVDRQLRDIEALPDPASADLLALAAAEIIDDVDGNHAAA